MKNIYVKLLFSYLLVLILALLITYISFIVIIKKEINDEISNNLERITNSIKISVLNILNEQEEEIQKEIVNYGKELDLRITLINLNGAVLADSNFDPKKMENHLLREEVQSALMGKPKIFKRYSNTLKENMYYYAILLNYNNENKIILRVSFFTKFFSKIYNKIWKYLITIFVSVLLIGIIISYFFSSTISRNFQSIYNFLRNLSSGDFQKRIFIKKPGDFKELSTLLNKTAENLEELFLKEKNEKGEISAIIENIKEPLAIINKNGKISYANSSFLKLFFKDSFFDLYYWQVINSLEIIEMLEQHLKDKKEFTREIKIEEKTFVLTIKDISEISETLIVLYDITSFKENIRIKKEFVANISHEIKTPLTVISGYLEILEENLKNENLEMVKKIDEQVKKLTSLTEEMLTLSTIEEGKLSEELEKVNILEPLKSAYEIYKIPFEKKGLFLNMELVEELPEMYGSKKLLGRMFINILDNSLKFTEKGGAKIKLKKEENNLIIEIEDTGIGIKEEDIPFIFERFYVSEKGRSKERSGFGLGLAIVKHIVELHNGKIKVKSILGKGTSFIILFPL